MSTALKIVTIPVPPTLLQSRPNDYSSLVLTALNFYSNGTQVPDLESENYISIKNPEHIIVQSDKAKYKPGNLVQFRILTVNEDLAGLPADVSYQIKACFTFFIRVDFNPAVSHQYNQDGCWLLQICSN